MVSHYIRLNMISQSITSHFFLTDSTKFKPLSNKENQTPRPAFPHCICQNICTVRYVVYVSIHLGKFKTHPPPQPISTRIYSVLYSKYSRMAGQNVCSVNMYYASNPFLAYLLSVTPQTSFS